MTVDILICTYNEGIQNISKILLPPIDNLFYKISFQVTNETYNKIPDVLLDRSDVYVSVIYSKGLSNNRNNAISISSSDICFVADDDVNYTKEYIENVVRIFKQDESLDVFVGKIQTPEGDHEYKKYRKNIFKISYRNISKISSIEVVFKRKAIIENDILFDSDFGLGGNLFAQGEEGIFLGDCLKKGLVIRYYPYYIVEHPFVSSGKKVNYDKRYIMYWGAYCKRAYGLWWGRILIIPLSIKQYSNYRDKIGYFEYLRFFAMGLNYSSLKHKL